jgi:hypothetical protein
MGRILGQIQSDNPKSSMGLHSKLGSSNLNMSPDQVITNFGHSAAAY